MLGIAFTVCAPTDCCRLSASPTEGVSAAAAARGTGVLGGARPTFSARAERPGYCAAGYPSGAGSLCSLQGCRQAPCRVSVTLVLVVVVRGVGGGGVVVVGCCCFCVFYWWSKVVGDVLDVVRGRSRMYDPRTSHPFLEAAPFFSPTINRDISNF